MATRKFTTDRAQDSKSLARILGLRAYSSQTSVFMRLRSFLVVGSGIPGFNGSCVLQRTLMPASPK